MKPEFTRPFNAEHAKAGAPYCCRGGDEATVLKWDGRGCGFSLIGFFGQFDDIDTWTGNGCNESAIYESEIDLVMIPLGMCEGRPVFVDDILTTRFGGIWIADSADRYFSEFYWPAPAKIYPVSLMTDTETYDSISGPFHAHAFQRRQIADAAIRHAIDAGQVVIAEVQP